MIYSQACAYAIRGLSHLAAVRPDGFVLINDLCREHDLPRHFLAKVFQGLTRKGLLISAKGRGGGFGLARPPEEILLYEIVEAIDGARKFEQCVVGLSNCDDRQPCPQHDQFSSIRKEILDFLKTTTLADMSRDYRQKREQSGRPLAAPEPGSKSINRSEPSP
ncbi:MAG: Rrf2 family transcriptional regulator [Phycisphaeraceae bacterium]|nr:Rrf2 family transcriptional regulator [Phycisphaeraceae bacterium]